MTTQLTMLMLIERVMPYLGTFGESSVPYSVLGAVAGCPSHVANVGTYSTCLLPGSHSIDDGGDSFARSPSPPDLSACFPLQ